MPALHEHMVAGGVSFTGFVDVPVCCPSRTSTLSARYSHNLNNSELGWCGNFHDVHENHTWIGLLKDAGYATGMFGKYFNAYNEFCGRNVHVPSDLSYVHLMCDDNMYFGNSFNVNGSMQTVGQDIYLTNVIGNASLSWLSSLPPTQPFFAYIAPHAPHVPATPAHEYENSPLPSDTAPRTPNWDYATQHHHWLVSEKAPLTPQLINYSDELFARRLRATMSVDDIVASVFDLLRARGQLENTYVIYSACAPLFRARGWRWRPPLFFPVAATPLLTRFHPTPPRCALCCLQRQTMGTILAPFASPVASSMPMRMTFACPFTWRAGAHLRGWTSPQRWLTMSTLAPQCWSWRA